MQSPASDKLGRTFICCIAFLDIVGYSKVSTARQLALKGWLNDVLGQALRGVAEIDRIILDTGDGVCIGFLGDPEDALLVCNFIRVALHEQNYPGMALRMGINLGPAKIVTDINGRPNVIGDGINVAQRVMSFADPDQILVSRSYYDVVARLSESYEHLFHYRGEHADKHVRKHEVYEVRVDAPAAFAGPAAGEAVAAPQAPATPAVESPPAPDGTAFDDALIASLRPSLTKYLGPIAPLLIAKTARRAADANEMIRLLADAIPAPPDRERFIREVTVGGDEPAAVVRPAEQAASAPPQPAPAPARSAANLTTAGFPALEQLLAIYIGPMAKILLAKAARRARNDEELVRELSETIDNAQARAAFLNASAGVMRTHKGK